MTNPVTLADIEARFRTLTTGEQTIASALLDDAWAILVARDATIATRSAELVDLLRAVESAMILRVLRNPDGKKQEAIDDYSWTRDTAISSGALYVSDAELALLAAPYSGSTRGSVRLVAYGEL